MHFCKDIFLSSPGVAVSSVSLQKRIIGGQNCKDDEWQYHVKVYRYDHTKYEICGGSLISDQWVLTAAHCWNSDPSWVNEAHVGLHPKRARKKMYPITQREVYRDSNSRYHDIMLLKLPEKTTIRPIKLPDYPPLGSDWLCLTWSGALLQRAGEKGGVGGDQGDCGGGFVFKNRLYGVCVFTGDPLYALNKPSAFLDVCAYKKWIDDTINQKP
uniref:Peptidase S1 domain-containing protein n=1 Tax=Xiphophorus couchianus TaxID=32473 RepID=A0A3B5KPZ6_9TELE